MSYISDYFRGRELDKMEISKQDRIYMVLAGKCLDGKLDECLPNFNFSISKKEQIEYSIQSLYGWERTSNGFEFRSNFRLAENGKDIVFDRYFIIKSDDKFESDGSEISDTFIKDNSEILEQLMKIYQVYDALSQQFESDIKQELDVMEKRWEFHGGNSRIIDEKTYLNLRHTNMYFYIYGELGKRILIKWLNELSDTQKSIDELLEKFTNDINDANTYFNEHLDEKYLKNYKFEYVLLMELMQYSPRGKVLRGMYRNMNEKEFKNNQKIRKSF